MIDKHILLTDPLAAKRTIERIKLHTNNLSPDFMLLFPGETLEDQERLVERYEKSGVDALEFWKRELS